MFDDSRVSSRTRTPLYNPGGERARTTSVTRLRPACSSPFPSRPNRCAIRRTGSYSFGSAPDHTRAVALPSQLCLFCVFLGDFVPNTHQFCFCTGVCKVWHDGNCDTTSAGIDSARLGTARICSLFGYAPVRTARLRSGSHRAVASPSQLCLFFVSCCRSLTATDAPHYERFHIAPVHSTPLSSGLFRITPDRCGTIPTHSFFMFSALCPRN